MAKKNETNSKSVIKSQGKATAKDFKPGSLPVTAKPVVKKGLGKGLDSLIPATSLAETESPKNVSRETFKLKISEIDPNPNQPRKKFDEDSLQELASSIKEHGLIEPIVVQQAGDRYIIVAGERRWRACRLAGLKEVPVAIVQFNEQELFIAALIENIQREDINPIEEAEAYNQLIKKYHMTQDEVANTVSKSRVSVTNHLRLLNLEERVRQLVVEGMISEGHARALVSIKDPNVQYRTAMKVFDERLSVRDTEKLVKKTLAAKPKKTTTVAKPMDEVLIKDLEEKIRRSLGCKVSIVQKNGSKGKIVIEYFSQDELDRLYDLLRKV